VNLTKHWAATLDDYVIDLAWSPDGSVLAAASSAGGVTLFDSKSGAVHHKLAGHDGGTDAISWRPLGKVQSAKDQVTGADAVLATGGQDGAVRLWTGTTGKQLWEVSLGGAWIEHLAWSSAETARSPVLAASAGRILSLIAADGTIQHTFPSAPKTLSALTWRPAGHPAPGDNPPSSGLPPPTSILAAAYFGGVCLWNSQSFTAWKEFPYNNGIHALAWSPDGRWLVSGNQDPSVHLWLPDQDVELHMSGYESKVKYLSFDHTSRWLATGGGRDASVWDCSGEGPEGREPMMFPHEAPVCSVAFQNAHGLLASASEDGVVMLWSPERKQPLRATVKMPAAPTRISWSPDDRFLAIGSEKGAVYVLKSES